MALASAALNCTKFGQLILRKIIKFVATRCHILRLKCTKFDLGWGRPQTPTGGAYSAPPDPGKGEGREGEGEESTNPPKKKTWLRA